MERSPGGASPSSMNLSTFLGGSSPGPSPGGSGGAGNYYANYSGNSDRGNTTVISNSDRSSNSVKYGTSMSIRHEIQRFESVHPSIYAIYDLIELIPDQLLSQQIREHVVCIEGKTTFCLLFNICPPNKVLGYLVIFCIYKNNKMNGCAMRY